MRVTKTRGVDYLVDEAGKKKAEVIDLSQWANLWEDFCGIMVSEARKPEDRVPWDKLKAGIQLNHRDTENKEK